MKFKDLTAAEIAYITHVVKTEKKEQRDEILSKHFKVATRTVADWVSRLGLAKNSEYAEPEFIKVAKERKTDKSRFYIVTAAQNATPVVRKFWDNIKAFASHLNASIHVVPYRYKNPTSRFFDLDSDYWDIDLLPYLDLNRHHLAENLTLYSDVKIQPTSGDPLSRLDTFANRNAIFAHSQMHVKSVAVTINQKSRVLLTTGAVTEQNYTDTKAGKIGENLHKNGFVLIEVVDGIANFRQIECDADFNFCDLFYSVSDGVVSANTEVEAYIMGDIHVRKTDANKIAKNIDLFNIVKPKKLILHDVADGDSINHHEAKNPVLLAKKAEVGRLDISREIDEILDFVGDMCEVVGEGNVIIVKSNHDEFFDRYVCDTDWRKDPYRAKDYIRLANIALNAKNGIIPYLINERYKNVVCLGYADSLCICGYQLALHGHKGANGAKGSVMQFSRAGKIITAHAHGAARRGDALQVGTSTRIWQDYTLGGLNSANNTDAVIFSNGTAQLIFW